MKKGGITMIRTDSSNIAAIEHEGEVMTVTFRNGRRYAYEGVTQEIYDVLVKIAATPNASIGKAFNTIVRGGGFAYSEITDN